MDDKVSNDKLSDILFKQNEQSLSVTLAWCSLNPIKMKFDLAALVPGSGPGPGLASLASAISLNKFFQNFFEQIELQFQLNVES